MKTRRKEKSPRARKLLMALLVATTAIFVLALGAGVRVEAKEKRLQGQVPIEDQLSGRSLLGYIKNIRIVGHNNILNRGMNGNLGWVDDCAYVSAYYGAPDADDPDNLTGLAVLDVANPRHPNLVKIWDGVPGTRESQVEGNQESRMVVVMPFTSSITSVAGFHNPATPSVSRFVIYDVPEGDCTNLQKKGTYFFDDPLLPETIVPHEHRIWRHIIYAIVTDGGIGIPTLIVVDASDKDNPVLLTTWDLSDEPGMPESAGHDMDISPDGMRAYVNLRVFTPGGSRRGLMILDTSEIAMGVPNPVIRRVTGESEGEMVVSPLVQWRPPENTASSHTAQLVNIRGRQYVIAMDEGFGGAAGCPWGWTRIIDVTDELNPIQISSFRLEVTKRRNCERTGLDNAQYTSHYIGVDNAEEAKLAFFTWYSSGLRVVDISDPYDPREVGYFIPGGVTDTIFQQTSGLFPNQNIDYAYSFVRYHQGNIWFNSVYGGFWVVRLEGKEAHRR